MPPSERGSAGTGLDRCAKPGKAILRAVGDRMHREPEIPALSPDSPSISVVIPTYNRLSLLQEAIDSVASQTRPPRELIVVDDGSTDGTVEALGRAAGGFPVRVVPLRHTGCIGRVRNEGV